MYKNSFFSLEVSPKGELLYSLQDGKKTYRLSPPAFEIDGKFCGSAADFALVSRRELGSSLSELHFEGTLDETLSLSCYIRVHAQTPFIRFRWELSADAPRFLTKSNGKDALVYLRFAAAQMCIRDRICAVQLGRFIQLRVDGGNIGKINNRAPADPLPNG